MEGSIINFVIVVGKINIYSFSSWQPCILNLSHKEIERSAQLHLYLFIFLQIIATATTRLNKGDNMNNAKPKQKFLPFREITLNSRPLVKRAITFSCDGELAVAADDSVHILVPEFPDILKRREEKEKKRQEANGSATAADNAAEDSSSDEDPDENPYESYRIGVRAQYSEGSLHMPVSYPPLDPRINKELFATANIPFPYDNTTTTEDVSENEDENNGEDGEGDEKDEDDDEEEDEDDEDDEEDAESDVYDSEEDDDNEGSESLRPANRPFGAGYGPITGVGSSMNHVVCMAWSPSGLGINRRPILAILTGAGVVAMYGDSGALANILPRANEGMIQRRVLNSWIVLWGVGERLMVPGQQDAMSENIRGIAWAREISPGQALLATINDVKEIAIICVQTTWTRPDDKAKGPASEESNSRNETSTEAGDRGTGSMPDDSKQRLTWQVNEVARFKADGPHPKGDMMDPHWVPHGTSFGLNWSPWLETDGSRICVLSFIDRNYVGFRKITMKTPWVRGVLPEIQVGDKDTYGKCLYMSTDSFVEFEDARQIWTQGPVKTLRGLIATPFHLKPFEVTLVGGPDFDFTPHTPGDCGTVYSDDKIDPPSYNPIVDLIVHPPNPSEQPPMPLFSLIRMSATATNDDWYQTNIRPVADSTTTDTPQWARDIAQKLEIAIPADMHLRRSYDEDDSDSGSNSEELDSDSDSEDDDVEVDPALMDGSENSDEEDPAIPTGPEIHPHRFRMHGLTISPGGGAMAVLASAHSTQHPERGGWHTIRSSVYFSCKRHHSVVSPSPLPPALTTEARLFEYLYGGGPPVPGITVPAPAIDPYGQNTRLKALLGPAVDNQTCDLCQMPLTPVNPAANTASSMSFVGCEKGHVFSKCATSGLAVQVPGVTRSCGACGLRTMRGEIMATRVLDYSSREAVVSEMQDGVCGRCGGKFLN
ncbi:hypothetical protein B0H67DRAFT_232908 [Lasiosphaeris hirsuta]|uniref:Transcription factor IIIC putative zinc-finger domain-containing protein n=1 Tax=Lasiosphaeris hirsuta TaxID=260670 RepID=A0AA40AFT3_9PEZI|nr:hypothetical protein B0H67DRAFT_232908 [Lasiosphaeris hirsuta]